jgi:hypothetical protein
MQKDAGRSGVADGFASPTIPPKSSSICAVVDSLRRGVRSNLTRNFGDSEGNNNARKITNLNGHAICRIAESLSIYRHQIAD